MTRNEMLPKGTRGTAVRERILDVASDLFYREGTRAVGVDTIVEQSGVAKTSLYRWFPTKDHVIEAFLQRRDELFWTQWDKVTDSCGGDAKAEILAQLGWISRYISSAVFRGCPFLRTATEFADPGHASKAVCVANKRKLRRRLLALAKAARARQPEQLADGLLLLIDGTFANSQVLGKSGPSRVLVSAGQTLVAAATR